MKQKKIRQVLKKNIRNIQATSGDMSVNFDAKAIHAFRIEVKKMHSFLSLIHSGSDEDRSEMRISRRLENVYKKSGAIRNLQLQQLRIQKAIGGTGKNKARTYFSILNIELSERKKKAKRLIKRKKNLFKKSGLLEKLPHSLGKKNIRRFVHRNIRQMAEVLSNHSIGDENLHQVRKILKYFLFDINYLKKYSTKAFLQELPNERTLTKIANLAGEFHDTGIAIELLDKELGKSVLGSKEKELLQRIRNEWNDKKELMLVKILKALPELNFRELKVKSEKLAVATSQQ